ncbi:MAG: VWA domain-containing protein, partial [Thermodesulfobacteriota bacterium]
MPHLPPDFHFLRPFWLWALVPAALLLAGLWWQRLRAAGLERICDPGLLPHLLVDHGRRASRLPLALIACAWLLAVTALAGPVWQRQPQQVFRLGSGRVLVLDLSPSMAATDITPSRLARARYEIEDLLRNNREGRTGLVVFAAEPHVVVPLTEDVATIAAMLPALAVEIMPVAGDLAGPALAKAASLLRQAGVKDGDLILVSDGVDDLASCLERAGELRQQGIRLSVLGIGTASGAPVPAPSGRGFVTGPDGAPRLARLDSASLTQLATAGGGRYSPLLADDRDSFALLAGPPSQGRTGGEALEGGVERWQEEGVWLVLPILLLALAGCRRGWLGLALFLFLAAPRPAAAFGWQDLWLRPDQQAAGLLAAGQAKEAVARFQDPAWRAVAQHQAGDYRAAAETGQAAPDARGKYNLGNSLAKAGRLPEAAEAYRQSLQLAPDDGDAQHNLELVQRLLDEQERQQPGHDQDDQGSQDQNQGQGQGQDGDQQEQGQDK